MFYGRMQKSNTICKYDFHHNHRPDLGLAAQCGTGQSFTNTEYCNVCRAYASTTCTSRVVQKAVQCHTDCSVSKRL